MLDAALRLFHPFMPFISEGIYQTLRQTCPNRDLEGVGRLGDSEHLISAAWPVLPEALVNRAAEEQMSLVQNTIRAIRDIRTRYKIAPRQPLAVSVKTHPQQANLLLSREAMIRNLANLERFAAGPDCEKPANAAVAVGADMEIYVHDVIDEQAERERLLKQKEEVSRNIQSVAGKLKNENFITRANPEVVQRERDRLQQLQEQLDMIQSNLNVLADGRSTRGQSAI
ncbi:MAG: Valine--tRNA ligase [Planctomycetes bacterium ADurb.Bin412]|nr:MAG: Valine--tRNA ligase [Planctomycetes bacterium ADurb.Bin412]